MLYLCRICDSNWRLRPDVCFACSEKRIIEKLANQKCSEILKLINASTYGDHINFNLWNMLSCKDMAYVSCASKFYEKNEVLIKCFESRIYRHHKLMWLAKLFNTLFSIRSDDEFFKFPYIFRIPNYLRNNISFLISSQFNLYAIRRYVYIKSNKKYYES